MYEVVMISFIFAAIDVPEKFRDIIQYAYYIVLGILLLASIGFAVWAGLSLERREEAMLKMKGVMVAFAMIFVIGAIFDAMGWTEKIGIKLLGV